MKLDEIEENYTRTDKETWAILYGPLLVRAVRQLAPLRNYAQHRFGCDNQFDSMAHKSCDCGLNRVVNAIDPDVEKLINE